MNNSKKRKSLSAKKYNPHQRKWDEFVLSLSDCDGMCNLCRPSLKTRCFRFKGIEEDDPPYPGVSRTAE